MFGPFCPSNGSLYEAQALCFCTAVGAGRADFRAANPGIECMNCPFEELFSAMRFSLFGPQVSKTAGELAVDIPPPQCSHTFSTNFGECPQIAARFYKLDFQINACKTGKNPCIPASGEVAEWSKARPC